MNGPYETGERVRSICRRLLALLLRRKPRTLAEMKPLERAFTLSARKMTMR